MGVRLVFAVVIAYLRVLYVVQGAYQDRLYVKTNDDEFVQRQWMDMETRTLSLVDNMVHRVLPILARASSQLDMTADCSRAILKTISGLKDGKLWAFQIVDSTGKPGGGQLKGTFSFYGSYTGCIETVVPDLWKPGKEDFRGKYCMVRFVPPLPQKPERYFMGEYMDVFKNITFRSELFRRLSLIAGASYTLPYQFGICLPSTCTNEDVNELMSYAANMIGLNHKVSSCETLEKETLVEGDQLAVIIVIGMFLVAGFTATFCEELGKKLRNHLGYDKTATRWKLIRAFSMRLNTKKIFEITSEQDPTFGCLNGIRFISICWVVIVHVYSLLTPQLYREAIQVLLFSHHFSFQIITSASLSVDSFFFITGVLVSYQLVTLVDKKGLIVFNVPIIIARRLWRLLPSAMMTLGLVIILPLMNSGPIWKEETMALARPTRRNWWAVLLSVSNFLRFDQMPMVSLWYISADIQLFLMSLIIFAILFRSPTIGYIIMSILAVSGAVISGLVVFFTRVLPVFILRSQDKDSMFEMFFFSHTLPHNHVSVYVIGMAVGIFFARNEKPTLPQWSVLLAWPLALILLFTSLFSGYAFTYGPLPTPAEGFVFSLFYRTVWALGLAIMTILCATRNGGYVNSFLSWKAFIPLNRLSYLVYLIHILVITFYNGSLQGVIDCYHHTAVWICAGNIALSFVAAYVMKVVFEAPVAELEKIVLEKFLAKKTQASLPCALDSKQPDAVRSSNNHTTKL